MPESFESFLNIVQELQEALVSPEAPCPMQELLQLVLYAAEGKELAEDYDEEAVEFLGWLELPLEDVDTLIVCGANAGHLPEARSADPFLPDSLRRFLGMQDNARRLARDIYALTTLLQRKSILFTFSDLDVDGQRLFPSQLLFPTTERELAQAVKDFTGSKAWGKGSQFAPLQGTPHGRKSDPRISEAPPVEVPQVLESVSVTGFRDFLYCPYRFYLKHVLGLQSVPDDLYELNPMAFGNLLHDVLQSFASSPVADSHDEKEIFQYLLAELSRREEGLYGISPLPALRVQLEQARLRLKTFAMRQASRRVQGWKIMASETPIDPEVVRLETPAGSLGLRGRIDRIDRHEETGEVQVIDYKTGDKASDPDKAHRKDDEWIDLQLPLYLYAMEKRALVSGESFSAAYFLLCQNEEESGWYEAEWKREDLTSAWETAADLSEQILQGEFCEINDESSPFDDFRDICRTGHFVD